MSYQQAMEAAGARILAFEQFGSYQGEWYALVDFDGQRGWVNGSYGSCSGCDAFESEFGWVEPGTVGDEIWDGTDYRPATEADVAGYRRRLADFGRQYLAHPLTQEEAEAHAAADIEWDSAAESMLAFVKSHAVAA